MANAAEGSSLSTHTQSVFSSLFSRPRATLLLDPYHYHHRHLQTQSLWLTMASKSHSPQSFRQQGRLQGRPHSAHRYEPLLRQGEPLPVRQSCSIPPPPPPLPPLHQLHRLVALRQHPTERSQRLECVGQTLTRCTTRRILLLVGSGWRFDWSGQTPRRSGSPRERRIARPPPRCQPTRPHRSGMDRRRAVQDTVLRMVMDKYKPLRLPISDGVGGRGDGAAEKIKAAFNSLLCLLLQCHWPKTLSGRVRSSVPAQLGRRKPRRWEEVT